MENRTLSCVYMGQHTGPEELLQGNREPRMVGARDMVPNPCTATNQRPGFCDSGTRENIFMKSNEQKRQAATWSSRNQWETHQRRVERLNERRQLHDASVQRELNNHSPHPSMPVVENITAHNPSVQSTDVCADAQLTDAVIPRF